MKTKGYCSDVFTDAAIQFIGANRDKPFFAYLAFNCPHTPWMQVPERYLPHLPQDEPEPASGFPTSATLFPASRTRSEIARVYGMVENIDDNLGRLFARLRRAEAGGQHLVDLLDRQRRRNMRYNAGCGLERTTVYEGGIHQSCFVRWPAELKAGSKVDRIAAHIDIAPTLLELCGLAAPRK